MVTHMIPTERVLEEYLDGQERSPFRRWLEALDPKARAKVTVAVSRVEQGNDSAIKSVGNGVCEIRIDWGPGYRVYFGFDGATLIILLAGGSKQRQNRDIAEAKAMWADYKRRKKGT
jgi:putative addiction module killer protein